MRADVRCVGISHKVGTGKNSGEPYDFYVFHGTYCDRDTDGEAVISLNISDAVATACQVGKYAYVEWSYFNGKARATCFIPELN